MPSYPVLAQTLSAHPSLQIFRSYSALNLKSILYYQAELAHLESELAEIEEQDRTCSDPKSIRREFGEDWWSLRYGSCLTEDGGILKMVSQDSTVGGRSRSTSPKTVQNSQGSRQSALALESRQWELMCRIRQVLEMYCRSSVLRTSASSRDV